jgi:hypothetical protein
MSDLGDPPEAQYGTWVTGEPIVLTAPMNAAKARYGAVVGAVAGALLPGATYLLSVDGNGLTSVEWLHAGLLAFAGACTLAGAVGGTVYAVENKPKED